MLILDTIGKEILLKWLRSGYFRPNYLILFYFSESLAFCGKAAASFEENQQKSKLNQVCSAQNNVFKTQLYQDLAINTNTYLGSIANFLIIAVPIFSGTYGLNQVKF